jgi:hypothetical protein
MDTLDRTVIVRGLCSSQCHELKKLFLTYGNIESMRFVENFDIENDELDKTTNLEIVYENDDDANDANNNLNSDNIVLDGTVLCSISSYNEECQCSYAEKHGTRTYRSCHGERCRNESHKSGCTYYTCTACFNDSSDDY